MKILAGYPTRLATLSELRRDLALFATSGNDWSELTKRLGAAFPQLDLFASGFVQRYSFGWRLTQKGVAALESMELHARSPSVGKAVLEEQATLADAPALDIAVGESSGCSTAATAPSRAMTLTPIERRSRFTVVEGGRASS
jgi:hypothetical protein